jgi:hypothetical protein
MVAAAGASLVTACDGSSGNGLSGNPVDAFIAALHRGADARCACGMVPIQSCSSGKNRIADCIRTAVPETATADFPTCAASILADYNDCQESDGVCRDGAIVAAECDRDVEAARANCPLPPAVESCLQGGGAAPDSTQTPEDPGPMPGTDETPEDGTPNPTGRPTMTMTMTTTMIPLPGAGSRATHREIRAAPAARMNVNLLVMANATTAAQAPRSTSARQARIATIAARVTRRGPRAIRAVQTSAFSRATELAMTADLAPSSRSVSWERAAKTADSAERAPARAAVGCSVCIKISIFFNDLPDIRRRSRAPSPIARRTLKVP